MSTPTPTSSSVNSSRPTKPPATPAAAAGGAAAGGGAEGADHIGGSTGGGGGGGRGGGNGLHVERDSASGDVSIVLEGGGADVFVLHGNQYYRLDGRGDVYIFREGGSTELVIQHTGIVCEAGPGVFTLDSHGADVEIARDSAAGEELVVFDGGSASVRVTRGGAEFDW